MAQPREYSFLLRVPLCIDPDIRIRWNSIGFAINSLKTFYQHLAATAPLIVNGVAEDWPEAHHSAMFSYAWGMVDQIYAICSIARKLNLKNDAPLARFVSANGPACRARNHMDHLGERTSNFIKRKTESPPLFGSLSFHHIAEEDVNADRILRRFTIITIMSIIDEKTNVQEIAENPGTELKVEYPNGNFQLQIEKEKVRLSDAYRSVLEIEEYFNTKVRSRVEDMIGAAAIENGFDRELALNQTSGLGFVFEIGVEINAPTEI